MNNELVADVIAYELLCAKNKYKLCFILMIFFDKNVYLYKQIFVMFLKVAFYVRLGSESPFFLLLNTIFY